ncbi:hypothetical protein ACIQHF_02590 [Pseudarthrobacter oxydans]|uniref:hypothetical protein n=1 Tax=Pseudarthrobacter oxydans TaxID=1671 RepID=UPI0038219E0D
MEGDDIGQILEARLGWLSLWTWQGRFVLVPDARLCTSSNLQMVADGGHRDVLQGGDL